MSDADEKTLRDAIAELAATFREELRALRQAVEASREPPEAVLLEEACRRLGCKPTKIYELLREGRLERVKVGKHPMITTDSIAAVLRGRARPKQVRSAPAVTDATALGARLRKVRVE